MIVQSFGESTFSIFCFLRACLCFLPVLYSALEFIFQEILHSKSLRCRLGV